MPETGTDRIHSEDDGAVMPAAVRAAFAAFPEAPRQTLLAVRRLILATASATPGVGPLTETLRWGEPAYLTVATRSGATVRLGVPRGRAGHCAIYVSCRSALVDTFRSLFPDTLAFEGDRAILLPAASPIPEAALATCLAIALTWHRRPRGTGQRIGANSRATGAP